MINIITKGKLECGQTISREDVNQVKLLQEFGILPTVSQAFNMFKLVLTCDVDGDGVVTANDWLLLQQKVLSGAQMPEVKIEVVENGMSMQAGPWNPPSGQNSCWFGWWPDTHLPNQPPPCVPAPVEE